MAKRIDERGFEIFEKGHGKKQNQKLKYLKVMEDIGNLIDTKL